MSKKEEHIDYSNLPDDLVSPERTYDPRPEIGHDGKEFERTFKVGHPVPGGSPEETRKLFEEAFDNDSKVFFEVMQELDVIEEFITLRLTLVRSKPAGELYGALQEWVEEKRKERL